MMANVSQLIALDDKIIMNQVLTYRFQHVYVQHVKTD